MTDKGNVRFQVDVTLPEGYSHDSPEGMAEIARMLGDGRARAQIVRDQHGRILGTEVVLVGGENEQGG